MLNHTLRYVHRVLLGLALCATLSPAMAQDGITLNLKDADIRTLIESVSAATGKNFIVDPRIKAKITVVSGRPLKKDELYQVFLSILQVHGYAAVPTGEIIKIVPDVTAKQGPVTVTDKAAGDELITRVIPVQHVSAAQLVPILRPLVPQQSHLAASTASNTLVVSDRASNIDRLEEIIRRIDRPEIQDVEVIPLQHASAPEVVRTLSTLQQQDQQPGAPAGDQSPNRPLLAADERTNSILLGGDRSTRLRLRGLIANLDTPTKKGGAQVVFLRYARAEELAPILLGVGQPTQRARSSRRLSPSTQPGGTGLGGTTPSGGTSLSGGALGGGLSEQDSGIGAAPVPTSSGIGGATRSPNNPEIDIQADERNNALVITAPPAEFDRLVNIIRQLDIRRAQVLVEAVIAEVSTDFARELGLQFAIAPDGLNDKGPLVLSNIGATQTLIELINNPLSVARGFFLGAADLREGYTNFAVLLNALAADAATNILSTPTLVTLDNEEAQVVVAQNVPFVTGQFTNTGAAQGVVSPFQTIERRDVGITLKLRPQINEGNAIRLDIEQEASSIAPSSGNAVDIITNTRQIATSVLVEDSQVLVLGGLIEDNFTDSQQKVPLLGDIPVLGQLFRSNSTRKIKRSLMVFIHPVILRDTDTATAYTNDKYNSLRARQLDARIQDRGLIKDSASQLPDLNELITQIPTTLQDDQGLTNMKPLP